MDKDNKLRNNESDIYTKKTPKALALITASVLIAAVCLNILFTLLGDKYLWYIDLTHTRYKSAEADMYTLSRECKSTIEKDAVPMVESINKEKKASGEDEIKVNIIFCSDKDVIEDNESMRYISYTARALEKEFPQAINVDYLNIGKNPSSVQKYKTNSASTIYASDVIVEFGSEYLVQSVSAFYMTDSTSSSPWAYNGEKKLASMILALTRAEAPICALTSNHGEILFDGSGNIKSQYSEFIKVIEGAGYMPQIIDLEKEEIPENCRMIITFGPTEDFKAYGNLGENNVSEIEKLDKFIDGSNSFLFVCDRSTPVLTNLDEYLEEWGIEIKRSKTKSDVLENHAIVDRTNNTDGGKGEMMLADYAELGLGSVLTSDMQKSSYPPKVIFPYSTAIVPSQSYIRSYNRPDEEGNGGYFYYSYYKNGVNRQMFDIFTSFDSAEAQVGGEVKEVATEYTLFSLMTVTQEMRSVQDGNFSTVNNASYVISLASSEFLTNEVLTSTAYGNTDVMLSVLRNTSSEILTTNIDLKAFYDYEISDTSAYEAAKPQVWLYSLVALPAVSCIALGAVVTIRRRFR